jgi:hypothetical protein
MPCCKLPVATLVARPQAVVAHPQAAAALTVSAERAPLLQPACIWLLLLARYQAGDRVLQLATNIPAGTSTQIKQVRRILQHTGVALA